MWEKTNIMPTVEEYTHLPEWVVGHSLKCSVHIVTVHPWGKGLRCHRCTATRTKKVRVSAFSSRFGSFYLGKKSNRRWGDQQHTFNIQKLLCNYKRRQIYTFEKVRKFFTCFVKVFVFIMKFVFNMKISKCTLTYTANVWSNLHKVSITRLLWLNQLTFLAYLLAPRFSD